MEASSVEILAQIVASVGLPVALSVFFAWQSHQREQRMASRIDLLEDFQRSQLVSICDKTTAALIEDAAASRANVIVIQELKQSLQEHHEFAVQLGQRISHIPK